jgi:uncharacterized protein YegL
MGRINFKGGGEITPPLVPVNPTEQLIIHDIYVLDASGSMQGAKFNNAIEGIKQSIDANRENLLAKFYTTLIVFSDDHKVNTVINDAECKSSDVQVKFNDYAGMTALQDAIGRALKMEFVQGSVLVKIFTDGEENDSKIWTRTECAKLIQSRIKDKWTISFVGTKADVEKVQKDFGILKDNTLVHDNTGAGVKQAFTKTLQATATYTSNLSCGLDVTDGFYKSMDY